MKKIYTFLLLALSQASFSQKPAYERYLNGDGICSRTITLYKDSSYCTEYGCEGSSFFQFGKWTQKQNTIRCTRANPASFKPILKVDTSTTNNNLLTVEVYDRKGNNITWQVTVFQHLKNNRRISMVLDSAKEKRTCMKESNSTIVLGSLQRILKQKIQINTGNATLIKIYLNIPEKWNFYINSHWENDPEAFSLIKTKNNLTSTGPYILYDHISGEPAVFTRQENQ